METLYFTAAGVALYLIADAIVNKIEQVRGKCLPQRSLLFFVIILTLAVGLFQVIQQWAPPPANATSEGNVALDPKVNQ